MIRLDSDKEQVIQELKGIKRTMKKGAGEMEMRISHVSFTEIFNPEKADCHYHTFRVSLDKGFLIRHLFSLILVYSWCTLSRGRDKAQVAWDDFASTPVSHACRSSPSH